MLGGKGRTKKEILVKNINIVLQVRLILKNVWEENIFSAGAQIPAEGVKLLLIWYTVHLDICHCPVCDNKYLSLSGFLFIIIPMGYKNIADDKSSFSTESHLIWNLTSSEGAGHELWKEIILYRDNFTAPQHKAQ